MLSRFRFIPLLAAFLIVSTGISKAQVPTQDVMPMPHDSWVNKDGSRRLALEFGGGVAPTLGSQRESQTRGWTYRMGGGFRFTQRFSLLAEYTFNHFAVPQTLVDTGGGTASPANGSTRLWSVTLMPTYEYFKREGFAAYVVGGGGLYRKNTNYGVDSCTISCTTATNNTPEFGARTNNAGGAEGGFGVFQALTQERTIKLFLEARYVWVDNPNTSYVIPFTNYTVKIFGAGRTEYLPVTAGIRW